MAGVALGVAVLFASLSAGATMDAAVARAAADEMGHSAVRVEALEERGLSPETVAAITKTAGVEVAAPALERKTYLAASLSQSPSAELPAPVTVLGIDAVAEPKLHDLPLSGGRLLNAGDFGSAVITETLASQERLRIGDSITLDGAASAGPTAFAIVGIVSGDGSVPDAAGRLVIVPLASAQALFDMTGVTRVDLAAQPGVTANDLIGSLENTITTEPYLLATTSDTADSLRAETADFSGTLLLVAAVVLFAGAFLIFNTLSMTVTERSRDVGLLRAAGTTRSQVMGLVMLQAFALGAIGSIVGVAAGIGLASLALSWVSATGPIALEAPDISLGSIVLALVIGVLITLAASLEPAWRAGRIPPVEALRRGPRGAVAGGARLRWLALVFGVLAVAALAVWPSSSSGVTGSTPGSGGPKLDFGILGPLVVYGLMLVAVLIMPRVLGPLLRLAGIPFRIFRNEERLARSSLARDISRTTLTAGALVMGLAMVVALGTAAQNIRQIGESLADRDDPRQRASDLDPPDLADRPRHRRHIGAAGGEVRFADRALRGALWRRAPAGGRHLRQGLRRGRTPGFRPGRGRSGNRLRGAGCGRGGHRAAVTGERVGHPARRHAQLRHGRNAHPAGGRRDRGPFDPGRLAGGDSHGLVRCPGTVRSNGRGRLRRSLQARPGVERSRRGRRDGVAVRAAVGGPGGRPGHGRRCSRPGLSAARRAGADRGPRGRIWAW